MYSHIPTCYNHGLYLAQVTKKHQISESKRRKLSNPLTVVCDASKFIYIITEGL